MTFPHTWRVTHQSEFKLLASTLFSESHQISHRPAKGKGGGGGGGVPQAHNEESTFKSSLLAAKTIFTLLQSV